MRRRDVNVCHYNFLRVLVFARSLNGGKIVKTFSNASQCIFSGACFLLVVAVSVGSLVRIWYISLRPFFFVSAINITVSVRNLRSIKNNQLLLFAFFARVRICSIHLTSRTKKKQMWRLQTLDGHCFSNFFSMGQLLHFPLFS